MEKSIAELNYSNSIEISSSFWYRVLKRLIDVLAAFLGLLFFAPVFAWVALSIRRDSPGPVFYGGRRAGLRGKEFKILKFRTMYERPESYAGTPVTADGDKRITRVGLWLRDTKLNELPQLWNVLIGEMSLVGPRPEDPEIAATWPEATRKAILSVRPGITSPASILYRNEEKLLNSENVLDEYLSQILPDKLRLDELYVKDQNIFTDLDVIFMTLLSLLPGIRNHALPETPLFAGPLYRFARRNVSWFFIDILTAFLSIAICGSLWRLYQPLNIGWGLSIGMAITMALLFSITSTLLGLKKVIWRFASPTYTIDLVISAGITTVVLWLINSVLLVEPLLPVRLIFDFGMLTFFGFLITRYRERLITGLASRWVTMRNRTALVGERVLVVGSGECGEMAIWLLKKSHYANVFSIVGYADDDFKKQDFQVNGYPVLGTTRDIEKIVKEKKVGLILFAIWNCSIKDRKRILDACNATGCRVVIVPDFLESFRSTLRDQMVEESS